MRSFAEAYPDEEFVQQVVTQVPWGHHMRLMGRIANPKERQWYLLETVKNGWSRNLMLQQIDRGLYRRQGQSNTNFPSTLSPAQSDLARQTLKDPYNFDFLSLSGEMLERDLEKALITHIREFLIELGSGFAFMGSQYPVKVDGKDYFMDLLFYHVKLRCYVVIDLKAEDFEPEFVSKMNFYLSAVDDIMRHPDDQPSIGIILCKTKGKTIVEYALRNVNSPIGVSVFELTKVLPDKIKSQMPTIEELEAELDAVNESPIIDSDKETP